MSWKTETVEVLIRSARNEAKMRIRNLGINVRVTDREKEILIRNAKLCSLSLSEYLRKLGLGKDIQAYISKNDERVFQMLTQLKNDIGQKEISDRLEYIIQEINK